MFLSISLLKSGGRIIPFWVFLGLVVSDGGGNGLFSPWVCLYACGCG